MKTSLLIFTLLFVYSCENKQEEYVGLWVEDFETSYIKFTSNTYERMFQYRGKNRLIYGDILYKDTMSNVLTIEYNKILDAGQAVEFKKENKYLRYKIDDGIFYFYISNVQDDNNELNGFYIREPYE